MRVLVSGLLYAALAAAVPGVVLPPKFNNETGDLDLVSIPPSITSHDASTANCRSSHRVAPHEILTTPQAYNTRRHLNDSSAPAQNFTSPVAAESPSYILAEREAAPPGILQGDRVGYGMVPIHGHKCNPDKYDYYNCCRVRWAFGSGGVNDNPHLGSVRCDELHWRNQGMQFYCVRCGSPCSPKTRTERLTNDRGTPATAWCRRMCVIVR